MVAAPTDTSATAAVVGDTIKGTPHLTDGYAELYVSNKFVCNNNNNNNNYYYYYFSYHRPILPGNSLEPTVIPTVQASSFTM
jgi:hypothetical protein